MEVHAKKASATRRRVLAMAGSAVALVGGFVSSSEITAAVAQATPSATGEIGRVSGIAWSFAVLESDYAYDPSRLQPPVSPEPGTQCIAALIEIGNDADQGLNFFLGSVRLRLADAIEYPAGVVFGEEPRINARVLNGGERARGWVWFLIPEDIEPTAVVFSPPAPQFEVALPSDPDR